jgi:hypothetical protein
MGSFALKCKGHWRGYVEGDAGSVQAVEPSDRRTNSSRRNHSRHNHGPLNKVEDVLETGATSRASGGPEYME